VRGILASILLGAGSLGLTLILILFAPRLPFTYWNTLHQGRLIPRDRIVVAPPVAQNDPFFSILFPIRNSSHYKLCNMTIWNIASVHLPILSMACQHKRNASWIDMLWLSGDLIFQFQEYLATCASIFCSPRITVPETVSCSGATPVSFIFNCSNNHLSHVIIRGLGIMPDIRLDPFTSYHILIFIQFLFS